MPSFEARTALQLTRDLKVFLNLRFGITRGQPPERDAQLPGIKGRPVEEAAENFQLSNSRNGGASTLLVSFCNVRDQSKPLVAAVGLCKEPPEVRWVQVKRRAVPQGTTGMCFWNDLVCVAHQQEGPRRPPGFVLLDPDSGFEQVGAGTLPMHSSVHSVCARDGDLYFVLTGMDVVHRATFDERSGEWLTYPYWTFPGSSGNENHLNSIDLIDGEICVSGFGRMEGDTWAHAKSGFVYNVDHEECLTKDIYHPHSLLEDSGEVWVVESPRRSVRSDSGEEYGFPPGYIRGLALDDGRVYVGSSRFRAVSESTGRANQPGYVSAACIASTGNRDSTRFWWISRRSGTRSSSFFFYEGFRFQLS